MWKLVAYGKDGRIHCCSVDNTKVSCCEELMPILQVNPDFMKLPEVFWCYECSYLLNKQEYTEIKGENNAN